MTRNQKNNLIKKVLFASHYNYLNLPVFMPVMKKLGEMKLDTLLLYLPGNLQLPEDKPTDKDLSGRYQELPLIFESKYSHNYFRKATLLIKLICNYKLIHNFIRKEKPCAVVVGSDLGNVHIRFLMDACIQYSIPVFVLYNCDIPSQVSNHATRDLTLSILNAVSFFPGSSFLRAVFFKDDIPGRYHNDASICVLSEDVRGKLIQQGMQPERIVATGMPVIKSDVVEKEVFLRQVGIPIHAKVIGWFPGPIGEVYDVEKDQNICVALCSMLNDLTDDVFLVIKLHPRETLANEAMIHNIFNNERCRIVKSMNAEEIVPYMDLLLGQFSRVLITAAAKGKRFLSINPWDDPRSLFVSEEREIMEIKMLNNLPVVVRMALNDSVFQAKMEAVRRTMLGRFTVHDEKDPALTIATLISKTVFG